MKRNNKMDEYEVIPYDPDEDHAIDAGNERWAYEHLKAANIREPEDLDRLMRYEKPFMSYEEEQAFIRNIEKSENTFRWPKGMEHYAKRDT